VGLAVPLIAGAAIFVLYFSNWKSAHAGQSGS
jgi:hypothetical protein